MTNTAYFAGGCFWCITPTFNEMDGVFRVTSGYSGGDEADPVYADVKYQRTGHQQCGNQCDDLTEAKSGQSTGAAK